MTDRKIFTVADYLKSAENTLDYWEKQLEKLKNGTIKYDGTLPKTCYNALIKSKIKVYEDVVTWLGTLPQNEKVADDNGLTKIGGEYYKKVNK